MQNLLRKPRWIFLLVVCLFSFLFFCSSASAVPQGGHTTLGAAAPSNSWYFAEGFTGGDYDAWLLVQNPNNAEAHLNVTYYVKDGGPIYYSYTVPASQRYSIHVDETPYLGNAQVSAKIESDQPVIAERSMYFGQPEPEENTGTPRIIIDLSDHRLYLYGGNQLIKSYPVAIGKPSTPTPVAQWTIGAKYYGSPGMVTGTRKMRLFRWTGSSYVYTAYNIHGTNQPWLIGQSVSHGCIRMYNSDVEDLFPRVPIGTLVNTVP